MSEKLRPGRVGSVLYFLIWTLFLPRVQPALGSGFRLRRFLDLAQLCDVMLFATGAQKSQRDEEKQTQPIHKTGMLVTVRRVANSQIPIGVFPPPRRS